MPKYFMRGTRWEQWERMLMDPSRDGRDPDDRRTRSAKTPVPPRSAGRKQDRAPQISPMMM